MLDEIPIDHQPVNRANDAIQNQRRSQRQEIHQRQVSVNRLEKGAGSRRQAWPVLRLDQSLGQRDHHLLLPFGPAIIVVGVAGPGVGQRPLAVHMLPARVKLDHHRAKILGRIVVVDQQGGNLDIDPAQRIDHGDEAVEVDAHVAIDRDVEALGDGLHCQPRSAPRLILLAKHVDRVDPLQAIAWRVHKQIARNR